MELWKWIAYSRNGNEEPIHGFANNYFDFNMNIVKYGGLYSVNNHHVC